MHRRLLLVVAALAVFAGAAVAEPRVTLKIPGFPDATFANYSAVVLPPHLTAPPEVWIEDALGEIQLSSVRIRLNDMPMAPFLKLNPLPHGVRIIVRIGASLSPEYTLRDSGENLLSVEALDETKVTYQGRFYLVVGPDATAPRAAPARDTARGTTVKAPEQVYPPEVRLTSEWPKATTERVMTLDAEITDREGLRRVVIEVDGRDVEEIVLENAQPVRKRDGFIPRTQLPGTVTGDARRLVISIPVRLTKDWSVVAVRAENAGGLRTRADRVIEVRR